VRCRQAIPPITMAHNVSDKKLRKGAAAGKQMPVHDSVIPLNAAGFEHPNRIKTPFTEEQKARVEKLVPIFMELQPDIVKGFQACRMTSGQKRSF
jgi:hypothetical protein